MKELSKKEMESIYGGGAITIRIIDGKIVITRE